MYGIPSANRLSEKVGGLFGHWNDYCDWDRGVYQFYIAAKLFKAYSKIDLKQKNCSEIKDAISVNGLKEYRNEEFNFFAWGSYIKK